MRKLISREVVFTDVRSREVVDATANPIALTVSAAYPSTSCIVGESADIGFIAHAIDGGPDNQPYGRYRGRFGSKGPIANHDGSGFRRAAGVYFGTLAQKLCV